VTLAACGPITVKLPAGAFQYPAIAPISSNTYQAPVTGGTAPPAPTPSSGFSSNYGDNLAG
jgi:hypothetical protein